MTPETAANAAPPLAEGQILRGAKFPEPMRVVTVRAVGEGAWVAGLVGEQSRRYREVPLGAEDLSGLSIASAGPDFTGDGARLRLGLQAYTLGIAWADSYSGLSVSRVDPLPHQLEAVYEHLLKSARVRFLLADDAGAGKTIMAGLLIRELQLRGLAQRILIVAPANLAFQWQRELKDKFDQQFLVYKGADLRDQYGVNQWEEWRKIITSLDLAKREDVLPGLKRTRWDLVIVDEAHRMSASGSKKSQRYKLGELLRDRTDHYLLLTATPHKGDPENFSLFLQLLDRDVYADVKSIEEAMRRQHAPFYLRRTKEAMVYFPQRDESGQWNARKIFTERIPRTVDFQIDEAEFQLYEEVTNFVKSQSAAAAGSGDPRARAVGFIMALYQRRLASSTRALHRSLENRAKRLENNLKDAKRIAASAVENISLPDLEELEEMEDEAREELERKLDAISLAKNANQVRAEITQLRELAKQAAQVETSGAEAKCGTLKQLLQNEGFFSNSEQRLLIFTEFKDTLKYLVEKLEAWGFRVGTIHGGMKVGGRDEPGTRIHAEQQFRDGKIQIVVATEAAGEGINLQCCNVMFNYDIPWNPNRLEQRMGRIHRYGQTKPCLIFNFVAANTIEGRILQSLLQKLQEIRDALDDDAVFNVVGEVLPAARVESTLRDYYAGKMGHTDLEERLLKNVDEGHFRSICQNALEGLATQSLDMKMLVERRARAQEGRLVPEDIARFLSDAADALQLPLQADKRNPHNFRVPRTPQLLRRYENEDDWRGPPLAAQYARCTTSREAAEKHSWEWVTPGHPLFEAVRRHAFASAQSAFQSGACFYSLAHEAPARIDFHRAQVADGTGAIIGERLFALQLREGAAPLLCDARELGNFTPLPRNEIPAELPAVAAAPDASAWLQQKAFAAYLEEFRAERVAMLDNIAAHVRKSLDELVVRADDEIGRAADEVQNNIPGAEGRLAQAQARQDELRLRRDARAEGFARQRALSIQTFPRLCSALVLPHPQRNAEGIRRMRPNLETEAVSMRVVMEYESARGCKVEDVSAQNLGYDIRSTHPESGELRLIEVKGLQGATGTILLTPNERRVAEDRSDCYWLYVVTNCGTKPELQKPIPDPASKPWNAVQIVPHYYLDVNALVQPMQIREGESHGAPHEDEMY